MRRSFDPPHLGPLALIEKASCFCSTLYVVAAGNPEKVGSGLFDLRVGEHCSRPPHH
jgi:phosphopantetheine adenylyltransferase